MARKHRILAVSALLMVVFAVFAGTVPLPYTVVVPGRTANTLGVDDGVEVIQVQQAPHTYPTDGRLLLTTIRATNPDASLHLGRLVGAWFDDDEAVVPRNSVYQQGKSVKQIVQSNTKDMVESQDHATNAAVHLLGLPADQVRITLHLQDVGGPSAGLLFSLGIVDKLTPDSLTGGRTIAGTGTIDDDGSVGAVGGVPMKLKAAKRDGATVFLVPKGECKDARNDTPSGVRVIPVTALNDAVASLRALRDGGHVPRC